MIRCPKCSAENDEEARYCDQCATALSPELVGKAVAAPCPACGGEVREVPSLLAVCQACGLGLGETPASSCCGPQVLPPQETVAAQTAASAAASEKTETADCPICALDNPVDAVRCGDCGILLQKTFRPYPCPRCKAENTSDKCDCGTVLTLSRLLEYVDDSVRCVCPTCKGLFSVDKEKCPDCGDQLEPAADLRALAKKNPKE